MNFKGFIGLIAVLTLLMVPGTRAFAAPEASLDTEQAVSVPAINPEINVDDKKIPDVILAGVKTGGKWGFIDQQGEYIIPAECKEIRAFEEGLIAVKKETGWGFFMIKGASW